MQDIADPRKLRGLQIAAMAKLVRRGEVWMVPSQSGSGPYEVSLDADEPYCTCADHETRAVRCKHMYAVEYVIQRERNADGSTTVTETVMVQKTVRKTYPQNWTAYNHAQTHEKARFQELLVDLCQDIKEPVRSRNGRPRLPTPDAIFACCFKVYSTVSARRFMTDLREAHAKGFISRRTLGEDVPALPTAPRGFPS